MRPEITHLNSLVAALLADPAPSHARAAELLAEHGGARTFALLLDMLAAQRPGARALAARALAALGDPRAIPGLASRRADPETAVREAAARALAQLGPLADASPITVRLEPLPEPAGQAARTQPTERLARRPQRWLKALAAMLLLLVAAGYFARGAWLVQQAAQAYRAASCSEVLRIADALAWQYPLALAPYAEQAAVPAGPCRALAAAADRQARHDWAGATATYAKLLADYPYAPFADQAAEQRDQALLSWGRQLRRDEDFEAALDTYALLTRPDEAVQARRRAGELALFGEWAEQRRAAGDFAGAVEHLSTLLDRYPDDNLAQPARRRIPQIMDEWAVALQAGKRFAEAEQVYADLAEWAGAQGQAELATQARADQARLYLAWSAALQAGGEFGPALSKLQQAAKADPQPNLPESTAARVRPALLALHTAWGQQLLGRESFNEAISHFQIVLELQAADRAARAKASDTIAGAYLAWGASLRGDEHFQLALQRIANAREFAATQPVTDTVQQAEAATLDQFAHSSGADAQALIDQAAGQVCGGQGQGGSPLLARADAPKRVRAFGEPTTIFDPAVRAGSPAELHLVACVEQQVTVLETCPYSPLGTNVVSAWLVRESVAWIVRLRSAVTAEVVAENTLYGTPPDGCPQQARFREGETRHARGSSPTSEALQDWLRGFIQ